MTTTAARPGDTSGEGGRVRPPAAAARWWRPRLLGHLLRTRSRGLAVWTLALGSLVLVYVSLWPSMADQIGAYAALFDSLPEAYRSIFAAAGASDLATPVGFFNAELFLLTAPLLLIVWGIGAGVAAVAGPEEQGLLDPWLSHPVSRLRWYTEHACYLLFGVVLLAGTVGAVLLGGSAVLDLGLAVSGVVAATVHLAALGALVAALALAVGAATGRPVLTRVVCVVVALVGYLLNALAPMASWIEDLRWLSPFRYALGDNPLGTGMHPGPLAVLLAATVLVLVLGAAGFARRDLRT